MAVGLQIRELRLRFLLALALAFGLWGLLSATPTRGQMPAVQKAEPTAIQRGEFDNLEVHPKGQYHLWRQGTQVTATFSSIGSAVQYVVRQKPQVLFTVPAGFRPATTEMREVEGWPVKEGWLDTAVLIPTRFRVQIAASGAVRYLDGPELSEVGHLAYVLDTTWFTPETSGTYNNREERQKGRYALRRTGPTVTGTFTTTRSTVQHRASPEPAVLFTVPVGYRPERRLVIEVKAAHAADLAGHGVAGRLDGQTSRLQVDPNGEVRYVNEAGVDEVSYQANTVAVTWATAEAPPWPEIPPDGADVCQRHPAVREALQLELADVSEGERFCAEVTWADLAGVAQLELKVGPGHPALQARDLAGLTGLMALTLRSPYFQMRWWPADLLAQTPLLQELAVEWYQVRLPVPLVASAPPLALVHWALAHQGDEQVPGYRSRSQRNRDHIPAREAAFLSYAPGVERLALRGLGDLAGDLLAHNSQLTHLTLVGDRLVLPGDLLVHNSQLTHLTLGRLGSFPEKGLAFTPQLQFLELDVGRDECHSCPRALVKLPEGMLAHSPQLRQLIIRGDDLEILPAGLLAHNHRLQVLHLDLISKSILPDGLLAHTPQLRILKITAGAGGLSGDLPVDLLHDAPLLEQVDLPGILRLPPALLAYNPQLQQLSLGSVGSLPPALLAHNPQLRQLSLGPVGSLPPALLAHNPQLRQLSLLGSVGSLPPGLLANNPQLEQLSLVVEGSLPPDLLVHSPRLQQLSLGGTLETLPENLLAHNGQLQSLYWYLPALAALPENLLAHNGQLQTLRLNTSALSELPENLLAHNSQLQSLYWYLPALAALPENLLAHNGQLQTLRWHMTALTELPENLLAHNGQLQSLTISVQALTQLPPDLLAHVSHLQTLAISGPALAQLPTDLLTHTPHLKSLDWYLPALAHLPWDWLAHTPHLLVLKVTTSALEGLPENWLARTPHLQELNLDFVFAIYSRFVPSPKSCVQKLQLTVTSFQVVPGNFGSEPCLQELTIRNSGNTRSTVILPIDFLVHAPRLRILNLPVNTRVPSDLLIRSPHLRWVSNAVTWVERHQQW